MFPIGIGGLFLAKKWLYRCFVFWTLFSASSAMNVGGDVNGSALQVWMFFGFLWLLRLLIEHLSSLSFSLDHRIARPCLWLIAFLAVASLSLMMPVYIDGGLTIISPILGDDMDRALYFTSHNVTQLLYLIFGVVIAICVAHANLREEDRHQTERILLFSALFISGWGLFQFFCNLSGIPYPDYIFNNSGSMTGRNFNETLGPGGLRRISSATLEPSVFAQDLLSLLPLTIPACLRRGSILSVRADRFAAGLFIVLLILSTASMAYLGLLVLAVVLLFMLLRTRFMSIGRAARVATVSALGVAAVVTVSVLTSSVARSVFDLSIVNKASSGSGIERLMTIVLAFGYFQKYPILGIGWGSATSHDLIVFLLANVGIVGALTFLGAMWCVLRTSWRALGPLIPPANLSRFVWFLSLALFLFTSLIGGFPFPLGNFWLVLGMAIATGVRAETVLAPAVTPEPA